VPLRQRAAAALLLVVALALELTSGCGVAEPVRSRVPSPHGALVVGYVAGWEPLAPVDTGKISAINYAFAHIKDGAVVLDQPEAASVVERLCALRGGSPSLRVLVSIGGWGADGFSDAALSDASRAKFAASVAALVARTGIDGVDIDWEYPGLAGPGIVHREQDRRNFTLLLAAIRGALDALAPRPNAPPSGRRRLLTAALADAEFVAHIELDRVAGQLDWINLMTYDFHNSLTPLTGHHAALHADAAGERSVERAVDEFLAAGVPARKLLVGVPFYGRAFAAVKDVDHGLGQQYGHYEGDHAWPQLKRDFIDRNGFVRYWDEHAQAPYLWNPQSRVFVSYDDPQSLALKAQFVRSRRLGGMMYWEHSQDPDGELFGAIDAAMRSSASGVRH